MDIFDKFITFIEDSLLEDNGKNIDYGVENSWYLENFKTGRYEKILDSEKCKEIIGPTNAETSNFEEFVSRLIGNRLLESKNIYDEMEVLVIGIAALQYFVQLNWTGPNIEDSFEWLAEKKVEVKTEMELDAENLHPLVEGTQWLLLARSIFVQNCKNFQHFNAFAVWWSLRCIYMHQNVLEDLSTKLHSTFEEHFSFMSDTFPWLAKCHEIKSKSDEMNGDAAKPIEPLEKVFPELKEPLMRNARTLFWTEVAQMRLSYSEVLSARVCLEQALDSGNMELSLTGAMGKRTRFQSKDVAQLTLKVERVSITESENKQFSLPTDIKETLPTDLRLDDDLRLPQIHFNVEEDGKFPKLTPLEQCVVLACYSHVVKSQPKDAIAEEEVMPYLNCVLSNPLVWSNQLSALLSRCKQESFHRRTIERSMTQAQLLADSIFKKKPDASIRLQFLFASHLPPHWKIQVELASLLISLGAVNSALDIFIRLQQWDDIVACYHLLELRHKAAEVIKSEIEKKPSVKLYCMLGDATDDVSCYEKAWDMSGQRSAKAQRHWGTFYYHRKEYETGIAHLEKSLELNSLQPLVMSRLAFMYMEKEDWQNCAKVYRQLCTSDGENFEAWNNLAKAYVKLGEKARAWKVLQESIKCNYENWQVWDNVMVVSIDCAEYQEALRAYHRLLDLKGSHVDTEVLNIIVKAVVEDLPDNHGRNSSRLRKKALELFGRLTSVVPNVAKIWQLYAQLCSSGPEANAPITLEKVVQFLQRAQRCATQTPNWCQELKTCQEAVEIMLSLANTCLDLCKNFSAPADCIKILASPRLAMKSMLTKIKMEHTDAVTGEVRQDIAESYSKLTSKFDEIVARNTEFQNTNSI